MKIRELREQMGLSQLELAKATQVSTASVCLWEKGERTPSLSTALMLADFFEVPLDTLVGRKPPNQTERDAS